jgi:hypothetical protein
MICIQAAVRISELDFSGGPATWLSRAVVWLICISFVMAATTRQLTLLRGWRCELQQFA